MKQRIFWVDNLRCFAIFCVVIGHMISCEAFRSVIGTEFYEEFIVPFHMPLFGVLSGWFLHYKKEESLWRQLGKKAVSILLPYFVWCFLWFFVKPLIEFVIEHKGLNIGTVVWQIKFFAYEGLCLYGWWFLRALFFCFIFAYFFIWLFRGRMGFAGILSCFLLYALTLSDIIPNMTDKNSLLKGFIYLYPFFWSGYLFRQYESLLYQYKSIGVLVFGFMFFFLLFFWNGEYSFYGMNTSALAKEGVAGYTLVAIILFRLMIGVLGSLFFMTLFVSISSHISNVFTKIGQETLGIYILQSLVYWSLPDHLLFPQMPDIINFCLSLFVSIVIVLGSYYSIRLVANRQYAYLGMFLFGKN